MTDRKCHEAFRVGYSCNVPCLCASARRTYRPIHVVLFPSVSRPTVVASTNVCGSLTRNSCFIMNMLCRLNSSIEASSTVPTGSSSWPINVRQYVMFIILAALKLGCYQRCSLQKYYRLGDLGEVMVHVFMTSGFEAPPRVTGFGAQKPTVTPVHCRSPNARRSIFDGQAHLILVCSPL